MPITVKTWLQYNIISRYWSWMCTDVSFVRNNNFPLLWPKPRRHYSRLFNVFIYWELEIGKPIHDIGEIKYWWDLFGTEVNDSFRPPTEFSQIGNVFSQRNYPDFGRYNNKMTVRDTFFRFVDTGKWKIQDMIWRTWSRTRNQGLFTI